VYEESWRKDIKSDYGIECRRKKRERKTEEEIMDRYRIKKAMKIASCASEGQEGDIAHILYFYRFSREGQIERRRP